MHIICARLLAMFFCHLISNRKRDCQILHCISSREKVKEQAGMHWHCIRGEDRNWQGNFPLSFFLKNKNKERNGFSLFTVSEFPRAQHARPVLYTGPSVAYLRAKI